MISNRVAIYPGTFDPPTYGHINIIERGLNVFEKIIIAVAEDSVKDPLFTAKERVEIIKEIFPGKKNVTVKVFNGLLVNYARKVNAKVILRGLRTVADFEYELQMALANKKLDGEIETVFMMTEEYLSYFSSSLIKEIAKLGGDPAGMVPEIVARKLKKKIQG
ncbi:MAG TPA: pantetheine-phosphate adenylyltransferase [bacterium]